MLFGKSLKEVKSILSALNPINFFKNIFESEDITKIYNTDALIKFNNALDQGKTRAQAWMTSVHGMSKSTQKAAVDIYRIREECAKNNVSMQVQNERINAVINSTDNLSASQKAAAVSAGILRGALSLLGNVGIMLAITAIAKGISYLSQEIQKAKTSVEDLNNQADELRQTMQKLSDNSKLASEFVELSKGVNSLGENVSLTADEFDRYHEIANQIAADLPERVVGYDEEGNAILNLKETVESLTAAYKENKIAAIQSSYYDKENTKQRKNALNNAYNSLGRGYFNTDAQGYTVSKGITRIEQKDFLKKIKEYTKESLLSNYDSFSMEERQLLFGLGVTKESIENDFDNIKNVIDGQINKLESEIKSSSKAVKEVLYQSLWVDVDFQKLSDDEQNALSIIVQNLSPEKLGELAEGGEVAIQDYVNGLIDSFSKAFDENSDKIVEAREKLIGTDFSEINIKEAKAQIDQFYNDVSQMLGGIDIEVVKILYPIDIEIDGTSIDKLYEKEKALIQQIKDKFSNVDSDEINFTINELGINTEAEIATFGKLINQYDTLSEAKKAYLDLTDEEINALAGLHDSFDYTTYSEQVDTVVKNTNTLKKAIDTLTESGSLEADTIAELAKTFPAYSAQILAAQGNSEQLKSVLTTAMVAQSSSLITTLEGLKGLSEEDQRAVDGLVTVLKSANSESTKYADSLNDLANKESLLDSVHKELNDDGYISVSTYQKLIEAGEDYADLVTIENGKLKIEEQALKDLIVQKYKDQVATIELAKAEKIRELAVMSSTGATQEEIQKIRDEIAELETAANRSKDIVSILEGYTPTDNGSKSNSKSPYSNELQLLKDDLNDGIITYEQFLQKWQALNDKYRAMSENEGGISDYEWGQNNRDIIAERTKAYEQEKARLKELYEAESITLEQYNAQLNASLNHWLGGYTQLSSEYEKEVKSNTKELSEYRKKEYDDEIKDLKELYENGEITLEQLDSKMSESANHWLGGIAGLSDEFKDAVDDNYDYIKTHFFDKIDRSLDELEDEYERTGDISLLDKRETTINNAISQADTELSKLYAKGLTEDNDDVQFWLEKKKKYNKDLESVLNERVDVVKDNVQETIEAFNDEYEKSGNTSIFDKQVSVYLQGQSAILDLIERYKDLGYSEESDAIKSLRKQYEEYGESIVNVYDKITNAITDSVDKQIEAIEEKFEKTGDVNTFNDKISVYQSGKTAVQTQIDKLIAKGYSESSEEVQKLVKQLADYDKEIIGVYSEITNYIETQTDNQLKSINELVALTGDTSALYRKIDVLNNGKLGIEGQIAKLLDEGYSESSEEVKSLYDKIKEYDNNILDVYSDIANRIDKETDKQLEIIDREIEKSGDTRQYQVRLNILADYKGQIQTLIDELLKLGYDANSEIVQDLLSKIASIDDDIRETSKDRIDAQVDAYEEVMSLESDQLEKYKNEQDEIFDEKIKALEDQKKALEDQSEEIEKQNELQEKQKNILDAQRGVMKSIRMIYSGNGQWTVSPTQESLENLKDAEKELEATQRKQQIEAIDKLIDGIEEQKKTFDDAIDEQTKAIQDGVDAFEKAMTDSYKVYAQLDYTLLKSILGEKDALKYYSDYNDVLAKNGVIDATMTTAKAELDDTVESLEEQSEANAKFTESTEQATKAVDTFAKKMQDEFGLGNVDLTTRPFVSGHKMRKAGYDVDPNGTSTVLSSVEYLWQGDEENGRYVGVHYTPILPNGEVLTDQELADYLHEVLEGSDDILKADNKGIILKIDDDLNLSEKDIRSLESGKLTKNMKTVLDAADAWDEALHNAQEKWMELWFAEYGNPNDSISAKAENIIDLFGNKVYGGILGKIQQILTNGSIGSLLPISSEALNQFTPKTASDQSNIVNSNIFNPVITNNITVNASSGNANDIRDAVKDVVDNRIIAGLKAFADGYNQSALNTMYGR